MIALLLLQHDHDPCHLHWRKEAFAKIPTLFEKSISTLMSQAKLLTGTRCTVLSGGLFYFWIVTQVTTVLSCWCVRFHSS